MLIPLFLFLLGLVLLMKGGDLFVDGATAVAYRSGMPEALIGATVVSIGTTLPELSVSAASALSGVGSIAYGNAIGSIVCNTALVAAITIVLRPTRIDRKALLSPILFFFGAAAVYLLAAYGLRRFTRAVGAILVSLFVLYLAHSILLSKKETATREKRVQDADTPPGHTIGRALLLLLLGGGAIAIGADLLVENGQLIATALGVPETIVALLFISLGTSLPELTTAVTALVKGHSALSLGNVIGANFLNLSLVSGLASLIRPFDLPASPTLLGLPASLAVDLPVVLLVSLLLSLPALVRSRVSRVQGLALIAIYVTFTVTTLFL